MRANLIRICSGLQQLCQFAGLTQHCRHVEIFVIFIFAHANSFLPGVFGMASNNIPHNVALLPPYDGLDSIRPETGFTPERYRIP